MENVNAWVCTCERERGVRSKCEHCRHAVVNDFSNHTCQYYEPTSKKSVKLIVCRFMVFPPLILIKISPQRYRITNPRLACCL